MLPFASTRNCLSTTAYIACKPRFPICRVQLYEKANRQTAKAFLEKGLEVFPYTIHTILTDNGIQFVNRRTDKYAFATPFERICYREGIEHRTTKINSPWINGQVERPTPPLSGWVNRTIKEATVQLYHYDSHKQLTEHLQAFIGAYNFNQNPLQNIAGLYTR